MKNRSPAFLLAAFALAGISFLQELAPSPFRISVLSYNVRYNTPQDGINAWPQRESKVARLIGAQLGADVAGLQEALAGQVDDLERRLPAYDWVGVGRDDGWKKGEFVPIFFKPGRLELLATDTFWLSQTPGAPGSKSWDAALPRIATWACFRDRSADTVFYFFNTHFDHRGEEARLESALLLIKQIRSIASGKPSIIAGDFNFDERSEPYGLLADFSVSGLRDARYASGRPHLGPTATFNDWISLRPAETRIDYLFVSANVKVNSHRIVDTQFNGRFPSDHLPVWAEVEIGVPEEE